MTPNARYAASIGILDTIFRGEPAEKTLTNWARSNRYAGSKDRAAVRDIVFDCLRCKRSFIHLAGFDGGRGCVAGHILAAGQNVSDIFTGEKFAESLLTQEETESLESDKGAVDAAIQYDVPDWIMPTLKVALGDETKAVLTALQSRGALDLRVNTGKTDINAARSALAKEEIETQSLDISSSALRVLTNPRRVALSKAYQAGLVEIQDAGSQAIAEALPLENVKAVLDFCAGGGGKSLAIAARTIGDVKICAYDQSQARMKDLPERAKRAGAKITVLEDDPIPKKQPYDLVLLDVPCSGTGAWRRNPNGKWQFTQNDLTELCSTQQTILTQTKDLVGTGGYLAYVTCSLLLEENENQIETFLGEYPDWMSVKRMRLLPSGGTDGFFLEVLQKKQS